MKVSLRASRVNASLTIELASKLLQVDPSTIVRWEADPSIVQGKNQDKIAFVYGMPKDNIDWSNPNEQVALSEDNA